MIILGATVVIFHPDILQKPRKSYHRMRNLLDFEFIKESIQKKKSNKCFNWKFVKSIEKSRNEVLLFTKDF